MATANERSFTLGFVGRDIRNQIEHSRDILMQVQELQRALEKIDNSEARLEIERTIGNLLSIARKMSANIASTQASTATASGVSYAIPIEFSK